MFARCFHIGFFFLTFLCSITNLKLSSAATPVIISLVEKKLQRFSWLANQGGNETKVRSIFPLYLHTSLKNACVCAKSLQSCPTLSDPMDCSPPGSSVHGILQARILEWAAISSSRGSSQPRDRTQVACMAGGFFII